MARVRRTRTDLDLDPWRRRRSWYQGWSEVRKAVWGLASGDEHGCVKGAPMLVRLFDGVRRGLLTMRWCLMTSAGSTGSLVDRLRFSKALERRSGAESAVPASTCYMHQRHCTRDKTIAIPLLIVRCVDRSWPRSVRIQVHCWDQHGLWLLRASWTASFFETKARREHSKMGDDGSKGVEYSTASYIQVQNCGIIPLWPNSTKQIGNDTPRTELRNQNNASRLATCFSIDLKIL